MQAVSWRFPQATCSTPPATSPLARSMVETPSKINEVKGRHRSMNSNGTDRPEGTVQLLFTSEEAQLLVEVIETALSDPDFIDISSSGGMSPTEADAYREDMKRVQSKIFRASREEQ